MHESRSPPSPPPSSPEPSLVMTLVFLSLQSLSLSLSLSLTPQILIIINAISLIREALLLLSPLLFCSLSASDYSLYLPLPYGCLLSSLHALSCLTHACNMFAASLAPLLSMQKVTMHEGCAPDRPMHEKRCIDLQLSS